jgi:hypothetical protein
MSLHLSDSKPEGVFAKTFPGVSERPVWLHVPQPGYCEMTWNDFLYFVHYALTNTDLSGPDDPRLRFLEFARAWQVVEGYNPGGQRIKISLPPHAFPPAKQETTPESSTPSGSGGGWGFNWGQ